MALGRAGESVQDIPSYKDREVDFWHDGPVVYQIYPRSFYDHAGRGEGTLRGITEKLPYLNGEEDSLGVDVIWISPFYKSPMIDGGYDVMTYREVDPRFGTIEDLQELVTAAHERGVRVMVDFVPNHMSTQSEWYKESSASRDNTKSDWFIYRDANPDGSPPNNWLSEFRERRYNETTGEWTKHPRSVWQYVPERNQYALCTFTAGQADLNWHTPDVRHAMHDEMRFLLDMGVDGFRVDMIPHIGKHPDLPDEPANPDYDPACGDPNQSLLRTTNRTNNPVFYPYIQEMVDVLNEYDDRFMILEDYVERDDPVANYRAYYSNVDPKKAAPFNFENFEFMMPRTAGNYKRFYDEFYRTLEPDDVPTTVNGNHDQSRLVTRVGREAARAAAVMQLTMPGMPFIYYGEELGMEDVAIPLDQVDDPFDGRDPERTPMLWTPDRNAGFSTADRTWLPVSSDYLTRNVEAERRDPHSFLTLYRRLLRMRRDSPALRRGQYVPQDSNHEDAFGFMRTHGNERLATVVNFSSQEIVARLRPRRVLARVAISSIAGSTKISTNLGHVLLRPNEALVLSTD
jgi:alpha-glucosidase